MWREQVVNFKGLLLLMASFATLRINFILNLSSHLILHIYIYFQSHSSFATASLLFLFPLHLFFGSSFIPARLSSHLLSPISAWYFVLSINMFPLFFSPCLKPRLTPLTTLLNQPTTPSRDKSRRVRGIELDNTPN